MESAADQRELSSVDQVQLHVDFVAIHIAIEGQLIFCRSVRECRASLPEVECEPLTILQFAKLSGLAFLFPVRPDVADVGHDLSHRAIVVWVRRLPCVQAIYVAVEHAEGSRDQNGIVNFFIRGVLLARPCDIFRSNVLAPLVELCSRSREAISACRRFPRWRSSV